MTSTLNPARTDRLLRRFATRQPEWFAVLTSAAYSLPLLALALLGYEQFASTTASPVLLAANAWCVLVPAVLLTALGWWGTAGFTRRSTWRSLVPFLPLILLYVGLPALSLVSAGVASYSPGYFILAAVTVLAVGFGEEATFRGVVLQTLLPRGRVHAVLLSSVLYAAPSIGNLAIDRYRDPVLIGGRVLIAVGTGVAFAAVRRSGPIRLRGRRRRSCGVGCARTPSRLIRKIGLLLWTWHASRQESSSWPTASSTCSISPMPCLSSR